MSPVSIAGPHESIKNVEIVVHAPVIVGIGHKVISKCVDKNEFSDTAVLERGLEKIFVPSRGIISRCNGFSQKCDSKNLTVGKEFFPKNCGGVNVPVASTLQNGLLKEYVPGVGIVDINDVGAQSNDNSAQVAFNAVRYVSNVRNIQNSDLLMEPVRHMTVQNAVRYVSNVSPNIEPVRHMIVENEVPNAVQPVRPVGSSVENCAFASGNSTSVTGGTTGQKVTSPILLYTIDGVGSMPDVKVYDDCVEGSCACVHYIGDNLAQLKPCRFAAYISGKDSNVFLGHPDKAKYIWEGVLQGFSIVDEDCDTEYRCKNYQSILDPPFYEEMCEIVSQEVCDGLVTKVSTPPRCVHALGGVEKSNGKLRPITDCSMPTTKAINNYMKTTYRPFSYKSVSTVVEILKPKDWMAVVDLKSAYRSVNVLASHTQFQGFSWDDGTGPEWYVNNRLSFGLRCAPNIFNALSDFVVLVAKGYGVVNVVNYLDDFIVVASSREECLRQRNLLMEVIKFLGFRISLNKVTEPNQVTTFLGITINSVAMELTLPVEKLVKLGKALQECLGKRYVTKKCLQQVGGLMSFCAQIVRGGRTFSRRLFDLCARARPGRGIFLCEETRKDLGWWVQFCAVFNCKTLIKSKLCEIPMVSDASKRGFGAWMGTDYFYGFWGKYDVKNLNAAHKESQPIMDKIEVHEGNINVYELWPVLVGLRRWGPKFNNKKLHIVTDNMQVLAMVNTGRSANHLCMEWLRELFWLCFIFNIELWASYIRSEDNILADNLSRLPYRGYVEKCEISLNDNNMCCSIYSNRSSVSPDCPGASGDMRDCPGFQESQENPSE